MDLITLSFLLGVIVLLVAIAGGVAMFRIIVTEWSKEYVPEKKTKDR